MFDPNQSSFWIIFPAFFVLLWLFILVLLSYTSGWRALSQRYRLEMPFDGEILKWQSGQMRWTNFNNCLKIGAGMAGLYLGIVPPFHFFMPPLLVPWNEISLSRRKKFLIEGLRMELGRDLKIPLWIRFNLANRLHAAAASYWPAETIG